MCKLHIALAELNIYWEDKEKNKELCHSFIKTAANHHTDLIIFPEMTLTGFSMNVEKIAEQKENSPTLKFFTNLSKKYKIAIAFGMAEYINTSKKKAWNKSYLVSNGKILLEYAKIHPFSYGEESKYYQGGNHLSITKINGVVLAPLICYDLRFPEPFQILSAQTDFIFVIANWPKKREEHWNTLLKARAIENQCYIAGINRCGNDPKLSYPSATILYNPYGKKVKTTILSLEDRANQKIINTRTNGTLYSAIIDKEIVQQYRKEFPLKADRRNELYRNLLIN